MSSTNARSPFAAGPVSGPSANPFASAGMGAPTVRDSDVPRAGDRPLHLTLAALSEDHTLLLLVDDDGAQYTLDLDNALRSALRGELPRPAHLETRMESALRPRDIQARIRAGESAEAVAELAGTSLEKIMPYAAPVLAEREHVADRAQRSSIRRRPHEVGVSTARTVEEAVDAQLRSHRTDPTSVEWDSYRRADGRWTVTGLYDSPARTGVATFTYDVQGNFVLLEDDDARWLVGDALLDTPVAEPAGLRSVPVPLGDDAIRLVSGDAPVDEVPSAPEPAGTSVAETAPSVPSAESAVRESDAGDPHAPLAEERTVDLSETVANIRGAMRQHVPPYAPALPTPPPLPAAARPVVDAPVPTEAPAPVEAAPVAAEASEAAAEPVGQAPVTDPTPAIAETAPTEVEKPAEPEKPVAKKAPKRRGRASVPSWDEIMFGGPND